jgi:hypothetical protein
MPTFLLGFTMGSSLSYPDNQFKTRKFQQQKTTWSAALIGPAIELSYGNPGERKRPQCNSKPVSNSKPEIQGFEI